MEERILRTLAAAATRGRLALKLSSLAIALGLTADALAAACTSLERQGLAIVWHRRAGRDYLVLTPVSLERLGVEVDPRHRRVLRRPGTVGSADLEAGAVKGLFGLDDLADPRPVDVVAIAERASELAEGKRRPRGHDDVYSSDAHPWPRVLLGERLQWPVAGQNGTIRTGPCEGCKGERLDVVEYCIVCDSSGNQRMLPRVTYE
jgi:hypothetical protein